MQIKKFQFILFKILIILFWAATIHSSPPKEVPGEEVTEEEFLRYKTARDTTLNKAPDEIAKTDIWYEKAAKSWNAPSVADQLDASESSLKGGMGGIFVPFMTDPEFEPEIDIITPGGRIIKRGKCGRIYNVIPGKYFVHVGSGSEDQRVVKEVDVIEGNVKVVKPDWAAITIKVINENNRIFRGEYEIARIDTFQSFGRGTGNDISLGEKLDTWVLKPGLYKIFNVGASYNSLKNFTTVRLRSGEYVNYTLVQDETNNGDIIGGGAVDVQGNQKINSNWHYLINIGGGIDLNIEKDIDDDTLTTNQIDVSLLFETKLGYIKEKIDWNLGLRIDEGISVKSFEFENLTNSIDELRITSLFTWRVLPNIGPYQRLEGNTEIFPKSIKNLNLEDGGNKHYFIVLEDDYSLNYIDSESNKFELHPALSPFLFEAGLGVSSNLLRTRVFDVTLLGGLGYTYEQQRNTYKIGNKNDIRDTLYIENNGVIDSIENPAFHQCSTIVANESHHILLKAQRERSEFGPEILLNTYLRLGRAIVMDSEFQLFFPFGRIKNIDGDRKAVKGPDFDFRNTISWRLINQLTLDYEFRYNLVQPLEEDLNKQEARHRVLLRFSFSRR